METEICDLMHGMNGCYYVLLTNQPSLSIIQILIAPGTAYTLFCIDLLLLAI